MRKYKCISNYKILFLFTLFSSVSLFAQANIAIIDFNGNGVSQNEAIALTDRLRTELFETGYFTVIERELMYEILLEQGFQQSGCITTECVVEVGKLIGVEQIISGSISKVGNIYTISSRIVSIETGEIIKTATHDHAGNIGDLLISGMKKVAYKLAGKTIIEVPKPQSYREPKTKMKRTFTRLIFPYSIGIETFAYPYQTSGESYSIWFGISNWRLKYSQAILKIPEVYLRDGFEKSQATIKSINIDYFFDSYNLKGIWIGSGLMSFDGSIGHVEENERGKYESIRIGFNSGYIIKLIHNISINIWGGAYLLMLGDEEIQVGGRIAYSDIVVPILSIDVGWHI